MPEPQNSTSQLLTTKQFCLIYNIDISTLRKRIKLGQIEAYHKPGTPRGKGGGRGRPPQIFIKDPGWQKVIIPENLIKRAKEMGRAGVYIYRGTEVARFLGVTTRTVRRWAEQGKIGFAKAGLYGARNRRYCIEDIRAMLALLRTGNVKQTRPSGKAKRKAVMDWGYQQLGIQPPPE